jgi:hypothetical protein
MPSDPIEKAAERMELVNSLLSRTDRIDAARAAFRKAYPDAPQHMVDTAVFHVYVDGIDAALDWVAAAERFLRDPERGMDYGATWHAVYHLYNWLQFEALMPTGRDGILELMADLRQFLSENDPQAALGVVSQLEEMFGGDRSSPGFE